MTLKDLASRIGSTLFNATPVGQAYNATQRAVPIIQGGIQNFATQHPQAAGFIGRAEPAYNSMQNFVKNIPSQPFQYQANTPYKPLNSLLDLGASIAFAPLNAPTQAFKAAYEFPQAKNPREAIGSAAKLVNAAMADPRAFMSIAGKTAQQPKFLSGMQKLGSAIKEGASTGARIGGFGGAMSGLEQGRDLPDLKAYVLNLLKQTATGTVAGGAIGGAVGGAGSVIKQTGEAIQGQARTDARQMMQSILQTGKRPIWAKGLNPQQIEEKLFQYYKLQRSQSGAIDFNAPIGSGKGKIIENPSITEASKLNKTAEQVGGARGVPLLPQGRMEVTTANQARKAMRKGIIPEFQPTVLKPGGKTIITPPTSGAVNAEATFKTTEKLRQKAALDEFNAWRGQYREKTVSPTQIKNQGVKGVTEAIKTNTSSPVSRNTEELKDINGFNAGFRDLYRNFKEVYGKRYDEVKRVVLDPFDKSKGDFIDMQKGLVEELDTNIVKRLGIQKGSKESELVQLFGEKKLTLDQLKQKTGNWQKIVEADGWFRNKYDTLLDEVNAVRMRIYPNDPTKIIPKRSDYYRHFRELSQGFQGLLNIFDTPAGITSNLSGISEFTKPKSKFLSFAQKRLGGAAENDAVGGFIDYSKSAAYAKHIDPNTARFRALADELAGETAQGMPNAGKLNNFVEYLQDVANDLSGKTNPMDRTAQKWIPGGRKTFQVINWLNSRVKANAVIGNLSSTIAQIFNVPQGIASAGPVNSVKGLSKTMASIFTPNTPMKQSSFIKERYASTLYDRFDQSLLQNTKKFAAWTTGVLDEVGTKYIWNSHYAKALSEGIQNPVKYADDLTRSLVAGRGIGEVPLAQKSKVFQLFAPFQLEVGNLWHVMGDMVGEKAFGKIATLFVANYLFNRGAEAIRGSDVTFDPIQATIEGLQAYSDEENKGTGALKFAGRLGGEVLSNIPVGQYVAAAYPEYGMKVGDTQLPTRKDLFGKGDPTRFGTGPILAKAITEPQYRIIPPFGGGQIKKTVEGVTSYVKGASEDKKGNIRFPIEQNVPNAIKSAAFGQYGTSDAREYFDNNRRALSEKQTSLYKASDNPKEEYNNIIQNRKENALIDKAKEQMKSGSEKSKVVGTKVLILQDNGDIKTVDPSFQPTKPELTGLAELDKKAISKFNGEITQKANDIYDLYKAGKLTEDEANTQLNDLKTLKASTGGGKAIKKITFKKVSSKKIKISLPKQSKVQNIKISALPKLKAQSKSKSIKIAKIKPIKIAKIKGLSGKKLA